MDAELKAKWIKALRSGRYKQIQYQLHTGLSEGLPAGRADGHCCIGVGITCARLKARDTGEAADKLGLTEKQKDVLIELNDLRKQSFAQIADYIEREL